MNTAQEAVPVVRLADPDPVARERDALVERLFQAVLGFTDLHAVYLGERLGLYEALDRLGEASAPRLAAATDTHPRYVREWLEQQAVSGILQVRDPLEEPDRRSYALPPGHREVLLERDSLNYLAALVRMMVGMSRPLPSVLRAFRTGAGVPYAEYPPDFCEGQGDMNRTLFVNLLAQEWLPALPEVDARLRASPGARVADVACGTGWSSIAAAKAYPHIEVHGIDLDPASIELARRNARAEGVDDRVRFEVRDAAALLDAERFDLVMMFEALHDMSRPVEALRALRSLLAPGGALLVADERVAERFTAPGDDVERLMYGWSILHCLPVGLAEQPSAATGTVLRTDALRRYAREAGLGSVEVVPVEHPFWRLYRLAP